MLGLDSTIKTTVPYWISIALDFFGGNKSFEYVLNSMRKVHVSFTKISGNNVS